MKLHQLLKIIIFTSVMAVWGNNLAQAEEVLPSSNSRKLSQSSPPANNNATQLIKVTGVRLNQTDKGVEIILETTSAQSLQVVNRSQGNDFIAEIPNAQLSVSQGNAFTKLKPIQGISQIEVINKDGNTIQVKVTGEAGSPQVELFDSSTGLIFGLKPIASTAQTPAKPPETPPQQESQTPEKPTTSQAEENNNQPIELVVTATRTEQDIQKVPRSITVINRAEVEKQTRLSRNLIEILGKSVPGLAPPTQSGSNFGLSLRGRNTQVLIDGVPQSTSRNAFRDLKTIDPSAIERVEVVRGPSAIYGDGATGGVINIITKRADTDRLTSKTEFGVTAALGELEEDSFGTNFQHTISVNEDKVDFTGNISFTNTGVFYDAEGDKIPTDPNAQGGFADSRSLNLFGKLGVNFDDYQRLQLTFNRFDEKQDTDIASDPTVNDLPGTQKARAIEGLSLDELPGNENTLLNLQYNHDNLLNSKVQAQAYYRNYLTRFFPFDGRAFASLGNEIIQSEVDSEKYGARLQIETPLFDGEKAKLLWGADYFKEETSQIVSTFDGDVFDSSGGLVFNKVNERTWVPPLDLSSLGLFAQLNLNVGKKLVLNGGVRYENSDVSVDDFSTLANPDVNIEGGDLDFDATLFNVGAVYSITDNVSVFANFSQGFSLSDIGLALRNAPPGFTVESLSPEPQKVDNYEIGLRGRWNKVQASLSAFYNESELGTTFTATGTVIRAPERIYGVEAAIDVKPSPRFALGGTLTLTGGEIDINDDGNYGALDGFRIPPLKLTAYVENETLPGWSNRLQALFSGERDLFADNTRFGRRPVDSYFVLDYISSIKMGAGTLQIGVENLLDNQYFPVVSQLQASNSSFSAARGRTLSLRYSVDW
ncbi:outer membrane receptor protein [Rivularia sp. PCC 7116]|uniref:TonB-dependent receptor domain-containing protein n=1 Tax=Rivularia sp. PCC 7116 TaxID=373994 RepID=UPI00029EC5CA|nr:TonB-dependent receptor [Rivularia sp. PCC 7116]AFY58513.1 outer membrane receptor protein [Rivularia sp. PCC 7116]